MYCFNLQKLNYDFLKEHVYISHSVKFFAESKHNIVYSENSFYDYRNSFNTKTNVKKRLLMFLDKRTSVHAYMLKAVWKDSLWPWLMEVSRLSSGLQTKGSLVWFQIKVHDWVVASSRCGRGNHTLSFSSSLSPSLPLSLRNK